MESPANLHMEAVKEKWLILFVHMFFYMFRSLSEAKVKTHTSSPLLTKVTTNLDPCLKTEENSNMKKMVHHLKIPGFVPTNVTGNPPKISSKFSSPKYFAFIPTNTAGNSPNVSSKFIPLSHN